ncbi:MAG: cytidine deaminase [Elusimicrobia bacterium]|nr:cytidine deaminase [Elusimicrobiota bacterium]
MIRAHGLSRKRLLELVQAAKAARRRAYCPYSKHPVGAAVLTASGRVYTGANVENASYGLSICAERVAVFNAVVRGDREILAVCVACKSARPCGACRQVMMEFSNKETALVLVSTGSDDGNDKVTVTRAALMLPGAFDPLASGLLPAPPPPRPAPASGRGGNIRKPAKRRSRR